MGQKFKLKYLGGRTLFFGNELTLSTPNSVGLLQRKLVKKLLNDSEMTYLKQIDTPTSPAITYYDAEKSGALSPVQYHNYRSIVGSIMYLASKTRPHLLVTASMVASNVE